ncbi:hypothetical protein Godav_025990 [Gossypium davidsonii]|uniref:HAT C-terminal dimerisation domain-containing protein n=1 Tax=Gossypium davidsonii TaxID=34287 RepID=A0A7J8THF1_GOSDV|nr:hypothetical protein [Gossypium davidsonii]
MASSKTPIHVDDGFNEYESVSKRQKSTTSKNSKSTSSSLTRSSNVLDNNPIDSSLYQLKVNRVDFGEDYDEKPELELNSQIDVLNYWSKSSIRYRELSFLARDLLVIPISTVASKSAFSMEKKVITSLRSSLKPKMVQAIV